jgi:3-oxoacyl-[acyl-carrier protein] reductase
MTTFSFDAQVTAALFDKTGAIFALGDGSVRFESGARSEVHDGAVLCACVHPSGEGIVTGGASGMGRHFTLALARAGASVVACDLNDDGLASLAAEAAGLPGKVATFKADVSQEAEVIALLDFAWTTFGTINGLVNNAGITRDGMLIKPDRETGAVKTMALKQWQQVLDVNLTGAFLCTREFAQRLVERKGGPGVVVNISSISRYGNMGQGNYTAAKAALAADTDVWGKELARFGIRVGCVAPGFTETPMTAAMRPEMLEHMKKQIPLGRAATPDEQFQGVKFIIECDFFTGRTIDIDGGMRL